MNAAAPTHVADPLVILAPMTCCLPRHTRRTGVALLLRRADATASPRAWQATGPFAPLPDRSHGRAAAPQSLRLKTKAT